MSTFLLVKSRVKSTPWNPVQCHSLMAPWNLNQATRLAEEWLRGHSFQLPSVVQRGLAEDLAMPGLTGA